MPADKTHQRQAVFSDLGRQCKAQCALDCAAGDLRFAQRGHKEGKYHCGHKWVGAGLGWKLKGAGLDTTGARYYPGSAAAP